MTTRYIVAPADAAQPALWEPALKPVIIVSSLSLSGREKVGSVWLHTGLKHWEQLTRRYSGQGLPVIVLTPLPGNREAMAALQAGAKGYCHAFAAGDVLRQAAAVVENGGLWVGESLVRLLTQLVTARQGQASSEIPNIDTFGLSDRERAVAQCVVQGHSNKQIARQLSITVRTVKAHISSIFRKLDVRDRLQLVLKLTGR